VFRDCLIREHKKKKKKDFVAPILHEGHLLFVNYLLIEMSFQELFSQYTWFVSSVFLNHEHIYYSKLKDSKKDPILGRDLSSPPLPDRPNQVLNEPRVQWVPSVKLTVILHSERRFEIIGALPPCLYAFITWSLGTGVTLPSLYELSDREK
jgi:hypothetical protein